ncbi:hypothetical protein KBI52_00265, partial [Microvirga sp. HBU67558]|nr:hypothetical protein [Microvirga sp. HBU67558]
MSRFGLSPQPSMQASFEASADIVEVDVHFTVDGRCTVFHDWVLDR